MQIIKKIKIVRNQVATLKKHGKKIGFVPTMGAFHEGHLSLFRRCKKENDLAVISIFVNPLQFGPTEDYRKYPRKFKKDISLAKKENIDIMFYPSAMEMYPSGFLTNIHVGQLTEQLCGKFRPGHFDGVATVVAKLIQIVAPDTIYLGQKDAQQCIIIEKMINDLNLSVKTKILPTVREPDGLAMSSRNQYLSPKERKQAPSLYQALLLAKRNILSGEKNSNVIVNRIKKNIEKHTDGRIDYVECVNPVDLKPIRVLKGRILIALAVWFGKARLIDNIIIKLPQ